MLLSIRHFDQFQTSFSGVYVQLPDLALDPRCLTLVLRKDLNMSGKTATYSEGPLALISHGPAVNSLDTLNQLYL